MLKVPKVRDGEENAPIATEAITVFRPDDNDDSWRSLDELVRQLEEYWSSPALDDAFMTTDAAELWGWF